MQETANDAQLKKLHIKTYGCQMNEADTEVVASIMRMDGYTMVDEENEADTVLLAVNSGVGISILPSTLIAFYNWPNVVAFPIEGSDALVSSIVAWNRSGGNPEVARFLSVSHLTELKRAK